MVKYKSNMTSPEGKIPNPFYFKLEIPLWRYAQVLLMSLTIVPLRLITMFILCSLSYAVSALALIGQDLESDVPFTSKRFCLARTLVHNIGTLMFTLMGFTCVKKTGVPSCVDEAAGLVFAPHSSFMDVATIFFHHDVPCVVTRYEQLFTPFFGKPIRLTQPFLVRRDHADSKQSVIKEIKRRASLPNLWPQFMLFPEGTTTNRRAICTFKTGGFIPGKPVQPVVLKFPDEWDTVTWTWSGTSGPLGMWLSLCKIRIGFEMHFLPIYKPDAAEMADSRLYADNVRNLMAETLKVPCVDLDYYKARKMAKRGETSLEFITQQQIDSYGE